MRKALLALLLAFGFAGLGGCSADSVPKNTAPASHDAADSVPKYKAIAPQDSGADKNNKEPRPTPPPKQ